MSQVPEQQVAPVLQVDPVGAQPAATKAHLPSLHAATCWVPLGGQQSLASLQGDPTSAQQVTLQVLPEQQLASTLQRAFGPPQPQVPFWQPPTQQSVSAEQAPPCAWQHLPAMQSLWQQSEVE